MSFFTQQDLNSEARGRERRALTKATCSRCRGRGHFPCGHCYSCSRDWSCEPPCRKCDGWGVHWSLEASAKQDIVITVHVLSASSGGQQIACTSLGGDVIFETQDSADSGRGPWAPGAQGPWGRVAGGLGAPRTLGDLRSVLACFINESGNAQRVALDGVAYTFGEFEEWYGAQHAHRMWAQAFTATNLVLVAPHGKVLAEEDDKSPLEVLFAKTQGLGCGESSETNNGSAALGRAALANGEQVTVTTDL
mmetsp:Transcript_79467/g.157467  ORF Transcript_79467/g.157467 Transcript_79467/m.157467 type:complete len:250 (-) Transcript_79467:291-1040(-)